MADSDRDEINRRFAELIGAEFGTSAIDHLTPEGADEPAPSGLDGDPAGNDPPRPHVRPFPARSEPERSRPVAPKPADSSGTEFLDLEFDDEVDYRATRPVQGPASHLSAFGLALIGIGLLLSMAGLFTSQLPRSLNWVAGLAWVVGLALLLTQALRRPDDPDDPHSQV